VKQALDHRPDYQAARLGVVIDRANNSAAQNALLPRLDFVGSYGYSGASRDFALARDQVRDRMPAPYCRHGRPLPLTFADAGAGRALRSSTSAKARPISRGSSRTSCFPSPPPLARS